MGLSRFRFALVFIVVAVWASTAAAGDKVKGKRHFENGTTMMQAEDFAGAAVEFEASINEYPTKNALYNLGMCQKALHRYPQALASFRRALREFGDAMSPDEKSETEANIAAISKIIGEVDIAVNVEGALVSVDGDEVGTSPLGKPVILGAGEHRIKVSRTGYGTVEQTVTLVSGSKEKVKIDLQAESAAAPVPAPVPGSAPPPPPASAPPPPPAAGPSPASPPVASPSGERPSEISRILKTGAIGIAPQAAGMIGLSAYYLSLDTPSLNVSMGLEWSGLAMLSVSAAVGGLVSWGYGTSSDYYDVNPLAMFGGAFVGAGVTWGAGYLWMFLVGRPTSWDDVETANNLTGAVFMLGVLPLLLPPIFEGVAYAVFRRPEAGPTTAAASDDDGLTIIPAPANIVAMDGTGRSVPGLTVTVTGF
ncbi:MAG: PEGA domain-containing protein [Deltaproteobacteria bacterium]|nr:PEGA domain-containing protein [Deltaproteobacteria bacterium]